MCVDRRTGCLRITADRGVTERHERGRRGAGGRTCCRGRQVRRQGFASLVGPAVLATICSSVAWFTAMVMEATHRPRRTSYFNARTYECISYKSQQRARWYRRRRPSSPVVSLLALASFPFVKRAKLRYGQAQPTQTIVLVQGLCCESGKKGGGTGERCYRQSVRNVASYEI